MNDPRAVSPASLPSANPARSTPDPAGAFTSRAPMAGEIPRPPAPRRNGDQLWPATAAAPARAATTGRWRPASSGPTVPFANSNNPTAMSGPVPATSYSPEPDTVPLPTVRRSTPARHLATTLEEGIEPAPKPRAIEAKPIDAAPTRAAAVRPEAIEMGDGELSTESFSAGVPAGTSQPEGTRNHQNGPRVPYPGGGADDRRKEHRWRRCSSSW